MYICLDLHPILKLSMIFLTDYLITYIEKMIAKKFDMYFIISEFYDME